MSDNQYPFEIIRDVGYVIQNIKDNETVWFNVKNDGDGFFTTRCSAGMLRGKSETSRAIQQAYKVTRGYPDPRDKRIEELEAQHKVMYTALDELHLYSVEEPDYMGSPTMKKVIAALITSRED